MREGKKLNSKKGEEEEATQKGKSTKKRTYTLINANTHTHTQIDR